MPDTTYTWTQIQNKTLEYNSATTLRQISLIKDQNPYYTIKNISYFQCCPALTPFCAGGGRQIRALHLLNPGKKIIDKSKDIFGIFSSSSYLCSQWRIQDGAFGANAPLKKLHTRSRYSNRAVNYSNKAVTMFMRQCSLPMRL